MPRVSLSCNECGAVFSRMASQVRFDRSFCSGACRTKHAIRVRCQKQKEQAPDRFWSFVRKTRRCWLWTASTKAGGYGQFSFGGKRWLAHRLAWFLTHGSVPSGVDVCHKCDNPTCVRPDHLFLGTGGDNARDSVSKGRHHAHPVAYGWDTISRIRLLFEDEGWSQSKIAKEFHVHPSTISRIVNRVTWDERRSICSPP